MNFKREEILSKVKCPVLIFHGLEDRSIPAEDSESAMKFFIPESKLVVIPGGDHKLKEQFDFIIEKSSEWLEKYLK